MAGSLRAVAVAVVEAQDRHKLVALKKQDLPKDQAMRLVLLLRNACCQATKPSGGERLHH